MINLNKTIYFSVSDLPAGKTQNIEIKIGRKIYVLDVEKNALNAYVQRYKPKSKAREKFSKYDAGADLVGVHVRPGAVLNREFFDNMEKIAEAQAVIKKFWNVL